MKHPIVLIGIAAMAALLLFSGCKKDVDPEPEPTPDGPRLIFRFAFDPTQARLNNLGQLSTIPSGHAAQSPAFHKISAHYLELAPTMFTQIGDGEILYHAPETTAGGDIAINFDQAIIKGEGENFLSIPLSSVSPGTYEYMRVSLSYQNYDIQFRQSGLNLTGRIASFVGFNNYITTYTINTQPVEVNDDHLQGYWGFETELLLEPLSGQAPPGATTVPNPIQSTSPIVPGSCVVTGPFGAPIVITGNETADIIVTLSLSTNNSFEWIEVIEDGLFEPSAGEAVVDMGLRGLIPIVN